MRHGLQRDLITLVVVTAALLVPFVDKPFNIDDPLFVWLGRHLQQSPWDFYGFSVNWYGTPQPMHEVTKNPPLAGYFIAAEMALLGFGERGLHVAFALPAVAMVLGTYFLARRLSGHPLEAALIAATTPVFLVCATSVTCDVLCVALFSWALVSWMAGLERGRWGLLVLSGFLAAASAAAKYFGASVVPLCFAWGLLSRRRLGAWCLPLLIPVGALGLYEWVSLVAYGKGLFADAALYATEGAPEIGKPSWVAQGSIGLSFLGGCVVAALFHAPFLWSRRVLGVAALLVALGAWALGGSLHPAALMEAASPPIPLPTEIKIQILLALLAGAGLLAASGLEVARRPDPGAVLLALWIWGVFVFASFLNWTNNGRSILPVVPAAAILLVRRLEWRFPRPSPARVAWLRAALVPSLVVGLAVTWADARWAHSIRDEAERLLARHHSESSPLRFQGHWGFQYYLERGGAQAVDVSGGELRTGELLALAENNLARIQPQTAPLDLVEVAEQGAPSWVRTHAWRRGAGFYSSTFGPLPYSFGPAPPDRYFVYRVRRPLRLRQGPEGTVGVEAAPAPR